jgi:acyl-coenzyme A synthetase/AMP-(fatty) acid ligase
MSIAATTANSKPPATAAAAAAAAAECTLTATCDPVHTVQPTDLASLVYTSGTTGKPKVRWCNLKLAIRVEIAWLQSLKVKYGNLLSSFAFNYRHMAEGGGQCSP